MTGVSIDMDGTEREFRVVFAVENGRAQGVALSQGERSFSGTRKP